MRVIAFTLRGDHIALDALLKATGLAPSGGIAKRLIDAGLVKVDGIDERRRSRKLRAGTSVECAGARVDVGAA